MFNYEQSIWGKGTASLKWSDPASFRLGQALEAIEAGEAQKAGEAREALNVLEVGCGAGQFIRAIKKIHPELNCFGCDISRDAVEKAKGERDKVEYTICEAKKLPYVDSSMDAVLIFDVLEHVEDPVATVSEIKRVLKPNGILYAFVPCEGDCLSLWNWLRRLGVWGDLTRKYAGHVNYFSRKGLIELFVGQTTTPHIPTTPPNLPLPGGGGSEFEIVRIRYSEHLLGQLIGIAAFVMMDGAARKNKIAQINNESFFAGKKFGVLRKIVNSLVFLESTLLSRVPSPNVHVVVRRSQSSVKTNLKD